MKRKIAKLLVVFCLILPCVFGLVACGENDKQVQISYVLNGGTNDSENPTIIETAGETIIKPATKEGGYMFVGWYTDEALTRVLVGRKLVVTKKNLRDKKTITLYAKWSEQPVFEIDGTEITGLTEYGKTFKSIVIPSHITTIATKAFEDCTSLTSVEIPASVTTLGSDACCDCDAF